METIHTGAAAITFPTTPEAFIAACEACLQDDGAQQARMDAGRAASWDSRVEEMCHILKEKGIWK